MCYNAVTHAKSSVNVTLTTETSKTTVFGDYSYGYELVLAAGANCYQYFMYNFVITYNSTDLQYINVDYMPFITNGTKCVAPVYNATIATTYTNSTYM